MLIRFLREESGATAIEYGLLAALIAVAIVAAIDLFSIRISGMYNMISNRVDSSM
jgi:pilus assembly protein Flp/PilA